MTVFLRQLLLFFSKIFTSTLREHLGAVVV